MNKIETRKRLKQGQILNNTYEITKEIGEGSGGVVYKAIHKRLNEEVVVKEIKNTGLNKEESRKEADILKKLKHPYLPRVYDFVEEDEIIYTVMDFIDGEDLSDILKREGAFSQKQVNKWAKQLGEALAYLHQQQPPIIHSDIKPSNIMITKNGDVCLIDFNISLAMGQRDGNKIGGSIGYAPPEQYSSLSTYIARIETKLKNIGELPYKKESLINDNIEILSNNVSEIEGDDETEILNDDSTEILSDDATEILDDNTEILSNDVTEILDDDTTEILSDDSTEILSDKIIENKTLTQNQILITPEMEKFYRLDLYREYIGKGIDTKSDIYSLGVTLYVLLTGKSFPLIYGDEIIKNELSEKVSEGFLYIILKMLELSPDKRYKDGSAYLDALNNCHKLDSRYIKMRRKQVLMQILSFLCIAFGVFFITFGINRNKVEKENLYYTTLQQASTAIAQQDFEQANNYIIEAKEMKLDKINAYREELHLLYISGNYEECLNVGQTYINAPVFYVSTEEDFSNMADIFYIVGNACYELKNYENAKILFESAINQNPSNSVYYRDYAICLAKLGDNETAIEQLNIGMEYGMSEDSLYMAKGEIASVSGKDEEALENFAFCIKNTEDSQIKLRAVLSTINVYRKLGTDKIDEEIQFIESYIKENGQSNNLIITEYLADSYSRKANTDKDNANEYYKKALTLFEQLYNSGYTTYQIQENIVILYENMGELKEAENRLKDMAESYPMRYEVYKRLAYLEADKQQKKSNKDRDYRKMKDYYNQAIELYKTDQQDMEMEMLKNMIGELENGGWF